MRVYCAECYSEIRPGDIYFSYHEPQVQLLFENRELNIFCSPQCAVEARMLEIFTLEKGQIGKD